MENQNFFMYQTPQNNVLVNKNLQDSHDRSSRNFKIHKKKIDLDKTLNENEILLKNKTNIERKIVLTEFEKKWMIHNSKTYLYLTSRNYLYVLGHISKINNFFKLINLKS